MNGYKKLENDIHEETEAEISHVHTNWPYESGTGNGRPQSRQHTGTEVAFFNVCYEIPVKVKREKTLKQLLCDVT